jgi:hypothetical protein
MADKKISQLTGASTPLAGSEVLPIVQSGSTVKVSVDNLTAGKAVSATTFQSTVATGTAPLTVASTTEVANLRAANATSADTANAVKSNATTGVLQVTGPAASSTRVMTVPNANFTAARTDSAQTFTGDQTFSNKVGVGGGPTNLFDVSSPAGTPSGTTVISRINANNWAGPTSNQFYADAYAFASKTTSLNYNRMFLFNMNSGSLEIDGVYWDGSGYVATSDTDVNIQKNSTGNTQTSKLRPHANNTYSIGDGTFRWSEVYASNGTINTSDLQFKTDVEDLSAAEKAVAVELKGLIKKFRYKDSVAKKGAAARIHVGVIAQDVSAAFAKHGLDANQYGLYCEDTVYVDADGNRFDKNTDRDGNVLADRKPVIERGVRYDQLFAFVVAAL